ncbi:MAG TPA: HNH endonuclease [Caulobacteraceae bacterium]|nr:HNH endonuclease [Caulobacteraceae bacterium]
MLTLNDLKPRTKGLIVDLVRRAGLNVSDWANSKRGEVGASTNPKYCYEWAFVQSDRAVVLNLWHDEMKPIGGDIVRIGNFRADPNLHLATGSKPIWNKRRQRLDEALQIAAKQNLPIRVIINSGNRRLEGEPGAKPSQVRFRELDPEPWTLTEYDWASGAHTLTRGALSMRFADQFSLALFDTGPPSRRQRTGNVFERDACVRRSALARAGGRREFCGAEGFRMINGAIYVETHHVVPLSEGGRDDPQSVVALCPNHHREAHHGNARDAFRDRLFSILRNGRAPSH